MADTTERGQREGDQPLPVPNSLPIIHDLVIEDMKQRLALGKRRYGTGLQPFNGRDALWDAYEEAQDLCAYLRQAIYERDNPEPPKPWPVEILNKQKIQEG